MKSIPKFVLSLCVVIHSAFGASLEQSPDIEGIIDTRVWLGYNMSIVVAEIDEAGIRYHARGKPRQGSDQQVDEDTLYEIGSITKTFTALLLARMIEQGEVDLEDTIDSYLPHQVTVPSYDDRKIRLVDLATHTSGLPTAPTAAFLQVGNPYSDFSAEKLYEFLASFRLSREIGSKFEYSNLGMGLLAHILSLKAGSDYESLVVSHICRPLGLESTRITLTPELKERLATGYDLSDRPASAWEMSVLAGAGDLRSSARDLAQYVAANLGLRSTALQGAMNFSHQVMRESGLLGAKTALGWEVRSEGGHRIVAHSGGTDGYRSFIGLDKKSKRGVVVLTNSTADVRDIGIHLLNPGSKLNIPVMEIEVDPPVLDAYVGAYRIIDGPIFEFVREGDALIVLQEGAAKTRIYPESESLFFYKGIDAKFEFLRDHRGEASRIVLHQYGRESLGRRVSAEELGKEIVVDAQVLDDYAGVFRFRPDLSFEFVREGNQLMVLQAGAPRLQIYPESESKFFYKVIDAKFTFVRSPDGKVDTVILHQFGREMTGKRVE